MPAPSPRDPYGPSARPEIPSVRPAAAKPAAMPQAANAKASERAHALRWLLGWLLLAGLAALAAGGFMWSVYVRPTPAASKPAPATPVAAETATKLPAAASGPP